MHIPDGSSCDSDPSALLQPPELEFLSRTAFFFYLVDLLQEKCFSFLGSSSFFLSQDHCFTVRLAVPTFSLISPCFYDMPGL